MEALTGQLTVVPDLPDQSLSRQRLIDELNEAIRPKRRLGDDNVYLGVLYAASNRVNLQGGCFEDRELYRLADMLVAAPVMVGHKKQELPVGRVFKADVVDRNSEPWLRAFFYWSRSHSQAEDLRSGIDSGVYRECSLGFLYNRPECSICRQDIRRCRHRVNENVRLGSKTVRAFYYYKEIQKVLEVSLVYRGAVEGTGVSTLSDTEEPRSPLTPFWRQQTEVIYSIDQLSESAGSVWVEPLYHGVWVHARIDPEGVYARTADGNHFDHEVLQCIRASFPSKHFELICQIVPVRGSSRLPLTRLIRQDADQRVRVYVADLISTDRGSLQELNFKDRRRLLESQFQMQPQIRLLPALECHLSQLESAIATRASVEGLRIIVDEANSRRNIELRLKRQIKVRLCSDISQNGLVSCMFAEGISQSNSLQIRVPRQFARENSVVLAQPAAANAATIEFLDVAPGEAVPDSESTLERLQESMQKSIFTAFLSRDNDCYFYFQEKASRYWLRIKRLNHRLLMQGRHFWTEVLTAEDVYTRPPGQARVFDRGRINFLKREPEGHWQFQLCGRRIAGEFSLTKVNIAASTGYLFSLAPAKLKQPEAHNE